MTDESTTPPDLTTWSQVDPARYPLRHTEVPALMRLVVPAPPPRSSRHDGRAGTDAEVHAWIDAVGAAVSAHLGPWAYHWYWTPGQHEQLGRITDRIPAPAQAAAFVADSLLAWRRWLESVAERFERFELSLEPGDAASGDIVTAWEAALTQLMTSVVAPIVDNDGWQGWCSRVLRWFLTAAGMPVDQARAAVDDAIDGYIDSWTPPSAPVLAEIAHRLARTVLGSGGIIPVTRTDSWPDTWPQNWPSWRATNLGRVKG